MRIRVGAWIAIFALVAIAAGWLAGQWDHRDDSPRAQYFAGQCPDFERYDLAWEVGVDVAGQLAISETLVLKLTGVSRVGEGEEAFELGDQAWIKDCLAGAYDVETVRWHGETLDATLTAVGAGIQKGKSDDSAPVDLNVTLDQAVLNIDLCRGDGSTRAAALCRGAGSTALTVRVSAAEGDADTVLGQTRVAPAADHSLRGADAHNSHPQATYRWNSTSAPVSTQNLVPISVAMAAETYLQSELGSYFSVIEFGNTAAAGVHWSGLSELLPMLVGLGAVAWVVRSGNYRRRLIGLMTALTGLSGLWIWWPWSAYGMDGGQSGLMIAGWLGASLAIRPVRWIKIIAATISIGYAATFVLSGAVAEASGGTVVGRYSLTALVLAAIVVAMIAVAAELLHAFTHLGAEKFVRFMRGSVVVSAAIATSYAVSHAVSAARLVEADGGFTVALWGRLESLTWDLAPVMGLAAAMVAVIWLAQAYPAAPKVSDSASRWAAAWFIGLMLALAVPFVEGGAVRWMLPLPVWLLQAAVWAALVWLWLTYVWPALCASAGRVGQAEVVPESPSDRGLWRWWISPSSGAGRHPMLGSRAALLVGLVPIVYFAWVTIVEGRAGDETDRVAYYLYIGLAKEAIRWIIAGFVFGCLYTFLPGRIGVIKAIWFSLLWIVAALVPLVVAEAAGADLVAQVGYRAAQFTVVMVLVGLLYDLWGAPQPGVSSLARVVGSMRRHYRANLVSLGPAVIVLGALGAQLLSGVGGAVGEAFVSTLSSVAR